MPESYLKQLQSHLFTFIWKYQSLYESWLFQELFPKQHM